MSYTAPQPIGKRKVTSEKRPHAKHAGVGRANASGGWRAIPPLPRYESVHKTKYQGPTDESNWVIPGLLMAGAYPAAQEDHVHYSIIQSLLALGISTFICLQAEYEHDPNIPEFMWRQGYKLRTYIFDALRVLKAASADPSKRLGLMCNPDKLDFRHVPIVDCSIDKRRCCAWACQGHLPPFETWWKYLRPLLGWARPGRDNCIHSARSPLRTQSTRSIKAVSTVPWHQEGAFGSTVPTDCNTAVPGHTHIEERNRKKEKSRWESQGQRSSCRQEIEARAATSGVLCS